MTVNNSRSLRQSLETGSVEGKYRFRRPNTEVAPGKGDAIVEENRDGLNAFMNYGFVNSEASNKVNPGS